MIVGLNVDNNSVEDCVDFYYFEQLSSFHIDTFGLTGLDFNNLESLKLFHKQIGDFIKEVENVHT